MESTLHGYSEDQLKGVDFEAIVKAYAQDSTKESVLESRTDGTKTRNVVCHDISAVEKLRALTQNVDPGGDVIEELRPTSIKFDRLEDPQHPKTTVSPPYLALEEGVMPIAIVGMSCRFPGGANDVEKFWELVSEGRSAWSTVPKSRFNADAFYHPDASRTDTVSSRLLFGLSRSTHG